MNLQEFVNQEKYLNLNDDGEFVVDFAGELDIIDFHTHMSNVLPLKIKDPNDRGSKLKYPTLPELDKLDLSVPYWTKYNPDHQEKGLFSLLKFSVNGYNIFKDMIRGGTYDNCFKSQQDNRIKRNVVLPISSQKKDRSPQALQLAQEYPDKFIAFCSVHPYDLELKNKIPNYKKLGARGLKLKITDLELKNNFEPLIEVFKECYQADLPVIIHTGTNSIKQENTSKLMWKLLQSTRVEIFGELLQELPRDFKFIFAHSGIAEYKLVAEYLKEFPASYAEVSTQSAESISYLIDEVGFERLLYGSDWPALPQALTLSRVLQATENNQQARQHILCKNAEQLLKISV